MFELDLQGVPDGAYQLHIDVADGTRALGGATLAIAVRKGLDDLVSRLEADARHAPEALRAEILFPVDRMRNVNRGRLELRTFDPEHDFAEAEATAAAVRAGKNPFAARTGDFKRHYLLASAGEIMPYRLYVPASYTPGSQGAAFPLIVALHGLGGTEDSFFTGYDAVMPKLAEQHGYIVAAPLGYRVDGSYGWGLGNPPGDPNTRRVQERSEEDVMQVLQLVRQQYRIDENRIYLAGHSMGGDRHVEDRAEVPGHLGGAGAVRRIRHPGDARADPAHPAVRRARRRRPDGQRAGIARDGRAGERAGHRGDLHRSPRRQPQRRGRAEPARHVRVLQRAQEERPHDVTAVARPIACAPRQPSGFRSAPRSGWLGPRLPAHRPVPPTYAADIEPILRRQCVGCHRAGDVAPFTLEHFDEVRRRGRAIAEATARRYMPPWKPVAGYGGPFVGARGLSDDEIAHDREVGGRGDAARGDGPGRR